MIVTPITQDQQRISCVTVCVSVLKEGVYSFTLTYEKCHSYN